MQFLVNPLSYLNYSKFMQEAIIEALNTKAFPNPKVAAVLTDNKGNIKATGFHHGPGTNHAEIDLLNKTIIDTDEYYTSLLNHVFMLIAHLRVQLNYSIHHYKILL